MAGNPKKFVEEISELSELSLGEDEHSEDKLPEPYDVALDSTSIFSVVTTRNLESFLQTLATIYSDADASQHKVIQMALAALLDVSKSSVVKEFLKDISQLVQTCFRQTEGQKNLAKRAIELKYISALVVILVRI